MKKNIFLADAYPELVAEWHPTKNGERTPYNTTLGKHEKTWWYLPYDDPETGKHFEFEWDEYIYNRIKGRGCPFLSGKRVWKGFNDLKTRYPELAKEWHPTKNILDSSEVSYGSGEKVWWYLPYDDPVTGKHFNFEWEARINNRVNGRECPFISGKAIWVGYNDLSTTHPELVKQWHPTKNALLPTEVSAGARELIWWYLPYDDPETGKHFNFEWEAWLYNRTGDNATGCPFLTGKAVWKGFNDLKTRYPELAKEWHPTKNAKKSSEVTIKSNDEVWWYLPYDDPETGKHFNFEWKDTVSHRTEGRGCPFISSEAVWEGYNDLATRKPEIAKLWHPTKNAKKVTEVMPQSNKKAWWYLPYDDPKTGKHFNFEWRQTISECGNSSGCPFLTGKMVWVGFNDLMTINPELANQWHPTRNKKKPWEVTAFSNDKVWWIVNYTDPNGKNHVYEWPATVSSRSLGSDCPLYSSSKTERLVYEFLTKQKISFIAEMKFDDCRDKLPLPFDVYIEKQKMIIELDGLQHFSNIFYDNYDGVTLPHDCLKNKYCHDKGMIILRIPYIYDPLKDREKIIKIVKSFLETGRIPIEVMNFYKNNSESNYYELFCNNVG